MDTFLHATICWLEFVPEMLRCSALSCTGDKQVLFVLNQCNSELFPTCCVCKSVKVLHQK